jgi:2-methylcitrate dehydratase
LTTHQSAIRIIDKKGQLHNPADRDHCLQYMVAIGLIFGYLQAEHYEDEVAADPRIDAIRDKMVVIEDEQYSKDYLDPDKRSIANAIQVEFKDGTKSNKIVCEYPIGHRKRRDEGLPKVWEKFENNLLTRFPRKKTADILDISFDYDRLVELPVPDYLKLFVI